MPTIIKLLLMSVAQGAGFEKVSNDTAQLRKHLRMASNAANLLGQAFGDLGSLAGGVLHDLLRGNVWAIGAKMCGLLVEKVKEHNRLMKDAALAAQGLSKEYMTLEAMARGYQKRVAEWQKQKAAADKAAADATKEAAEADKLMADARADAVKLDRDRLSLMEKLLTLEAQTADEIDRAKAANGDDLEITKAKVAEMERAAELAVKIAEARLANAQKNGSEEEQLVAQKELELALERQKRINAEADKLMAAYNTAQAAHEEEARKAEELAKRKAEEAAATQARKEAEEAEKARIEEAEAAHQAVIDAANELAAAQTSYANALRNLPQLGADIGAQAGGMAVGGRKAMGKAGTIPVAVQNAIVGNVADAGLQQAIQNGVVVNMKQAHEWEKQMQRQLRGDVGKAYREQKRDTEKYEQLKQKGWEKLSDNEKKWVERYQEIAKAREKRVKEAEDARKRLDDAAKLQQKAQADLAALKKRFCDGGAGNK